MKDKRKFSEHSSLMKLLRNNDSENKRTCQIAERIQEDTKSLLVGSVTDWADPTEFIEEAILERSVGTYIRISGLHETFIRHAFIQVADYSSGNSYQYCNFQSNDFHSEAAAKLASPDITTKGTKHKQARCFFVICCRRTREALEITLCPFLPAILIDVKECICRFGRFFVKGGTTEQEQHARRGTAASHDPRPDVESEIAERRAAAGHGLDPEDKHQTVRRKCKSRLGGRSAEASTDRFFILWVVIQGKTHVQLMPVQGTIFSVLDNNILHCQGDETRRDRVPREPRDVRKGQRTSSVTGRKRGNGDSFDGWSFRFRLYTANNVRESRIARSERNGEKGVGGGPLVREWATGPCCRSQRLSA
ncbi:hypothetical protein WN51_10601 [Melipona quadrifasciata]|uniref:Uncharacterized protein n=1 Tax=Melipona quadrifasciata TaxID=166423 RepID=A0A0N0BIJ8_9HYME|nr:hypothetical protein WN51_10601 [Melipona quadrifasciata]